MTQDLGIAGRLAKSFLNSKLTPLFIAASLALGIFAVAIIPRVGMASTSGVIGMGCETVFRPRTPLTLLPAFAGGGAVSFVSGVIMAP